MTANSKEENSVTITFKNSAPVNPCLLSGCSMPTVRRVQILQRLNNEAGGKINRMRLKCACEHSTEGKSLPKPVYFAFLQAFAEKIIKKLEKTVSSQVWTLQVLLFFIEPFRSNISEVY
jgi:hypothetical protein